MWQTLLAFLEQLQMAWGSVNNVVLRVLLQLAVVVGVSYGSYSLCHLLYRAIQRRLVKARPESLLAILLNSHAIPRTLQVVPLIVAGILATRAVSTEWLRALILTLTRVYFAFICANVFAAAMNLAYRLHNWRRGVSASPQKGIF